MAQLAATMGEILPGLGVLGGAGATFVARSSLQRSRRERSRRAEVVPQLDELARLLRGGIAPATALGVLTSRPPGAGAPTAPTVTIADRGTIVAIDCWVRSLASPAADEAGAVLRVGQRLGSLTPELVASVAAMVDERRRLDEEVTAQAAQARLSGVVMVVAPLLFFVLMVLGDPRASQLMLHTPIGAVLLVAGLGLDAVALWWMQRLIAAAKAVL